MSERSLGVVGSAFKENEQRAPLHPAQLTQIPEDLRKRMVFERGYGDIGYQYVVCVDDDWRFLEGRYAGDGERDLFSAGETVGANAAGTTVASGKRGSNCVFC